jgi:tetratricopeptide (TPR) repeat protein
VAGHLFMAGMLAEEDPPLAWRHARAARSKGGRIAVVRETVGLVAYRAGEWAEAISELRAARRMSGGPGQLPVMADCERALGHPEKAIELSRSAEAADLDPSSAAELTIVVAGARADMGQLDAALANLESAVRTNDVEPYTARLFYAYADLLLQADRRDEAIEYFMKAADLDVEEETDAGDRLTELADEEADLSGAETTDFVAENGESSDEDTFGDGDVGDSEVVDRDDPTGTLAGSVDGDDESGTAEAQSSSRIDDGSFHSDADEQDKLLMTADDDDQEPSTSGDADDQVAGMSVEEAEDLDEDDDREQALTEDPNAAEQSDDVAVAGAVRPVADEPERPAPGPGTTGSLFSHHEGGL